MSTSKHLNLIAAILLSVVLVVVLVLTFNSKVSGEKAAESPPGYEKYFDENSVMTVDIDINDKDWEDLLANAQEEKYINCDVIINGERIKNVGIRAKGNSSLMQVANSGSQRFSFKIEFDHYITGQTFHGLDKLVLNNTQADATYMKEFMSYEIFESAGVAVPLHSYAQIKVNGINKGLYLALESMEESYANRVFGSDYGQLYRPESVNMGGFGNIVKTAQENAAAKESRQGNPPDDARPNLPDGMNGYRIPQRQVNPNTIVEMFGGGNSGGTDLIYTDDNISSYSAIFDSAVFKATDTDFKRVITALKNLNNGTELDKYINVEDTLRYFAAQTFIINFDSYYGNLKHNYYLYEKNGLLTMLPWDLNLSFAGYESGDASSAINNPIDTPLSGVDMKDRPMLSKLLEVPEYKEMYHEYLKEIVTDYIDKGAFSAKIAGIDKLIKLYVEDDPTAFYTIEEYEAAVPVLEQFGLLRAQSINGQLDGTIPSTTDGQKSDQSTLVDTGDLNLSVMGSQGGNGALGKGTIGGNMGFGRNFRQNQDNRSSEAIGYGEAFTQSGNPGFPGGLPAQRPGQVFRAGADIPADGTSSIGSVQNNSPRITESKVIGLGVFVGVSILGLLFSFFYKRRKYHL